MRWRFEILYNFNKIMNIESTSIIFQKDIKVHQKFVDKVNKYIFSLMEV